MKYLLIALFTMSLQGCMWQTANTADIIKAVEFCGSADKIISIDIFFAGDEKVKCFNGKSTMLDRVGIED